MRKFDFDLLQPDLTLLDTATRQRRKMGRFRRGRYLEITGGLLFVAVYLVIAYFKGGWPW
ncbi:MAG: hypothetical protein A2139_14160 [Desulfobacca sp. RBG_16_60_12]|nr:MAG: hypothetical protein A2139_14160 [Desulfobacca sp. RBG_16_60_12]